MDRVLRDRTDVVDAMTRPGLGQVSFLWGKPGDPAQNFKGGEGVAKIVAKHGEDVARAIPNVIAEGQETRRFGDLWGGRVAISDGKHTAVLSLQRFGQQRIWVLTGWKEECLR